MAQYKPIKNYEHIYEISDTGEVYSHYTNKILRQNKLSNGYCDIQLSKNGEITHFLIHRLVAEAFIPNPENKPVVNHINGIKDDNRLENLEWVTYQENTQHAIDSGTFNISGENHPMYGKKHTIETKQKMREQKLGKNGKDHPRSTPVKQICPKTMEVIKIHESQGLAAKELNISQGNIYSVLSGKRKTAGGFIWEKV